MKRTIILASFASMVSLAAVAAAEVEEVSGESGGYVGAAASLTLPQGGSGCHGPHRVGGAALRAGYYVSEFWALEGEAAWLEDFAGLSAAALWHWWGYERLDPFFTLGARGWVGRGPGQVGPKVGVGTFYHLTDNWSLRADADATLGLDSKVEMLYTISAGVQFSF